MKINYARHPNVHRDRISNDYERDGKFRKHPAWKYLVDYPGKHQKLNINFPYDAPSAYLLGTQLSLFTLPRLDYPIVHLTVVVPATVQHPLDVALHDGTELRLDEAADVRDDLPGRLELVRDDPLHARLEVGEEREPDPRPVRVSLHQRLVVRQRVIVQEQAAAYVEGHEHVDGVVLVGRQDEEDPEHVHHPRQRVQEVQPPGGVCKKITFVLVVIELTWFLAKRTKLCYSNN